LGGLRDRLHIFPYTYYLVGRPGPIVRRMLAIMVGTTLLVLPLATLLVLQLRFLAYQDQAVTWAQRVAVWFDVAVVIALWPVIMDPSDSWRDYHAGSRDASRRCWTSRNARGSAPARGGQEPDPQIGPGRGRTPPRAIRGWQASRRGAGIAESTTCDRTRNAVDLA
jgi:hypothetical protein